MERIDDLNLDGLKVIQNTDYFCFGMDSVLLANSVACEQASKTIVDLGTGTAVMPIILSAKTKAKNILGIELQQEMFDLAKKNIKMNKLEEKIKVFNLDLKDVKKLKKVLLENTGKDYADIVISNPPYKELKTGMKNVEDVKYIARNESHCTLEDALKTASMLLNTKGKLYIVHKPERLPDLVCIGRKYNLEVKEITFIQPTLTKRASIVLVQYVFGGGKECKINPVVIEYDEEGNYTKDMLKVYGEDK